MTRNERELLRMSPVSLAPMGRLVTCAACNQLVDVIEIPLGGTGQSMRPDLCGECQHADPEPVVGLARVPYDPATAPFPEGY